MKVIGALGTVTKGLIQGLEDLEITGRVETIQTTASLRSTRILRRDLRRLVVTQIPVKKKHRLTLVGKTRKGVNDEEEEDHPGHSTVETGEDTQESPGNLRRLRFK